MGNLKHNRQRGFTLLELLVALVVISIILSVAVLSIGDGGRADRIRRLAKSVTAQFSLVAQEAVLNARQYGVRFFADGYQYLRFEDGKWLPVQNDSMMHVRHLPEAVTLKLYLDGIEASLAGRADDTGSDKLKPDLVFYSSAEHTPFVLELAYTSSPFHRQRIEGKPVGPYALTEMAESP
jgi:general secretion pathway protein H